MLKEIFDFVKEDFENAYFHKGQTYWKWGAIGREYGHSADFVSFEINGREFEIHKSNKKLEVMAVGEEEYANLGVYELEDCKSLISILKKGLK